MHDGSVLEERGVPSLAICTEVFFAAGKVQARVLGHNELEPLTVTHPIQSLTQEQIRGRAEGIVEKIVERLINNIA
ncbi:MAG: hypothetical protein OXM61_25355 [Candidatus Poribacteria bacterium]|nr:hypothetical protein [Candidatus Poribacteria bacterium]